MSIKSVTLESFLDGPKKDYITNHKVWSNKKEWAIVGKVRERIMDMYQARTSNCKLNNYNGSKSWDDHWDMLMRDYLMYSTPQSEEAWRSNVKSSIAYRVTNFIDARERKQEIRFLTEARNGEDERSGKSIAWNFIYEDYLRRNQDVRYKFLDASKTAKILGTSIVFVPYTIRLRSVQTPKDIDIKKEDLEAGQLPKKVYESKIKVDFEDVDFVPVPLKDFYIDPNATELHGTSGAAVDAAAVFYCTPSQVRLMFQGDPDVKNLEKIDSVKQGDSFAVSYFDTPKDTKRGYGELAYYYNVETDSEVVMYGNILLKNGPIPYKDKMLPFFALHFVRIPGQFYGMGVGDVTIQQSAEEEALKNYSLDRIKLAISAPTIVGATIFGDIEDQWDRIEPNSILKVGDVTQIRPYEVPNVPFDAFRMMEMLKDETIMNTGVNPQGMVLPMRSTPATNTLSMKENISDMVNMYSDNLMRGMLWWGKLLYSRFDQFYRMPTKKNSLELEKKELRELRLEDIDLFKDDKGTYKTRQIKGSRVIGMEQEMFDWKASPRVYVSPDFISPLSTAFRMRKVQEGLPQLAPFAGERGVLRKDGTQAPIDVRKLLKWYLKGMDMEAEDLLVNDDEDKVEEIRQAQAQEAKMQNGEDVPGVPGEPLAHRYAHATELRILNNMMGGEDFLNMMNARDEDMAEFVRAMIDYRKALVEHLRIDCLLAEQSDSATLQEADVIDQSLQQPQIPMNNMVSVPTVTGNQGLPNQGGTIPVPNSMDETDVAGQIGASMV